MQPTAPLSKKKAIIVLAVIIGVFSLIIWGISLLLASDENQFGKFIRIQNYEAKIKNLPSEVRDATESYLYNVTVMNIDSSINASKINDAKIREGSNEQELEDNVYTGTYIVDMASIKQSYGVSYTYSSDDNKLGGNPVVVSCLPKDKLIYGEFKCTDIVSKQASKTDNIIRYLPYQNFSFKISPDATQGETLVLVVTLSIPESDLKGSQASRLEVLNAYKKQVTDWVESKGVDPKDYVFQYNYDDAGNFIPPPDTHAD